MAPKKKGGKKKKDDGAEPPHDASWVRVSGRGVMPGPWREAGYKHACGSMSMSVPGTRGRLHLMELPQSVTLASAKPLACFHFITADCGVRYLGEGGDGPTGWVAPIGCSPCNSSIGRPAPRHACVPPSKPRKALIMANNAFTRH